MSTAVVLAVSVVVATMSLVASYGAFRNVRITRLFGDVGRAHSQRGAANRALTAAYLTGADPAPAKADVAAAEEVLRQAEARLPRRSRHTRRYFASKETP